MKFNVNITIEANVSCFVIPNSIALANEFFNPAEMVDHIISMNAVNNITTDPYKTPLVQLWWHSDDLHTDNIARHGFCIFDNEDGGLNSTIFQNRIRFQMSWLEYVPAALFEGHKEGDVIDLKFSHTFDNCYGPDGSGTVTADFIFHTKLDQLGARYRRFGNFEDILGKLMEQGGYKFNKTA